MRVKDIPVTANTPAADDYSVLDGNTNGYRRIRQGTVVTRDVPAAGDASATQVVLGNDSRLSALSTFGQVSVNSPTDGDVLLFTNSAWRNTQKTQLTDGGNF